MKGIFGYKRFHVKKMTRSFSWLLTKSERQTKHNWTIDKETKIIQKNIKQISTKNRTHPEYQYLNLIDNIIKNGVKQQTRNGITKTIIGHQMRFDLSNNKIPLLTTKKMAWKSCLKELLWFISGDTDNKTLKNDGVTIWNDNGSREFLDYRKLYHYREDDLGPIYGYQWRNYNLDYVPLHRFPNYKNLQKMSYKRIDQLTDIIDNLKDPNERYSRRLILTAWNPEQLDEMALPPCHILSQFHVINNKLSCSMYQRSGDVGLGIPFNIASYSFLTILLAHHCGLEPGEFIHFIGNAHIYEEHEEALKKQILRQPKNFASCFIKNKYSTIDEYKFTDFEIKNYKFYPTIKMKMIA